MNDDWKRSIFATHIEPQTTALGSWPGEKFPGVALPCREALTKWIIVRYQDRCTCAQVYDVGPWTISDKSYVFGNERPLAEKMKGKPVDSDPGTEGVQLATVQGVPIKQSNGAGIDLFPAVARTLGLPVGENVLVDWRWVEI